MTDFTPYEVALAVCGRVDKSPADAAMEHITRVASNFGFLEDSPDRRASALLKAFTRPRSKAKRKSARGPAHDPKIDPDAPLRLADAIVIAFPNGGPTPEALRREARAGRLELWRVGGKDFTSINASRRMLERCRAKATERDFGSDQRDGTPTGELSSTRISSSETGGDRLALDAALMLAKRLRKGSQITSPQSTRRKGANVISLKSKLRT